MRKPSTYPVVPPSSSGFRAPVALMAAAATGLAFLVYAGSLANGLVWDDPIVLARQLPVYASVWDVLRPPRNIPQLGPDYFRPLVTATLLLDRRLGGGDPFWFHLTVVLAHCLTTLGVFVLGRRVFFDGVFDAAGGGAPALTIGRTKLEAPAVVAMVGAALFAVHPMHTEAVAWAAGRADVLAAMGAVIAAVAFLAARRHPGWGWVAGAATLLALLAKEVAVTLVVMLPVLDAWVPEKSPEPAGPAPSRAERRRVAGPPRKWEMRTAGARRYLPVAIAFTLYAALRFNAIGFAAGGPPYEDVPPIADFVTALGFYLYKLVLPIHFNAYIAELPRGGIALLASGGGLLAVSTVGLWLFRRGERATAALLVWMAAAISPALIILVKIPEAPIAERYLYLPSVGFCLLLGRAVWALGYQGRMRRAVAAVLLLGVLAWWAAATVDRSRVWKSDMDLWGDTVEKSPTAGLPFRSLAAQLLRAGRVDEAASMYRLALGKRNNDGGRITIFSNLGTIAMTRGDLAAAESHYRDALAIARTPDSLFNLSVIALTRAASAEHGQDTQGRRKEAESAYAMLRQAEGASPHDADIQAGLGQALWLMDRHEEARGHYERALELGVRADTAAQIRQVLGATSH